MNSDEAARLIEHMGFVWPSYRNQMQGLDPKGLLETWMEFLGDQPYDAVRAALKQFKGDAFAPSLPQIVQAVGRVGQPSDAEALEQAMALAWWRDQVQYENGSGYSPERPEGIHPEVARIVGMVGTQDGWRDRFRFAWRDR